MLLLRMSVLLMTGHAATWLPMLVAVGASHERPCRNVVADARRHSEPCRRAKQFVESRTAHTNQQRHSTMAVSPEHQASALLGTESIGTANLKQRLQPNTLPPFPIPHPDALLGRLAHAAMAAMSAACLPSACWQNPLALYWSSSSSTHGRRGSAGSRPCFVTRSHSSTSCRSRGAGSGSCICPAYSSSVFQRKRAQSTTMTRCPSQRRVL